MVVRYDQDVDVGNVVRFVDVGSRKRLAHKKGNRRCGMEHRIDKNPDSAKLEKPAAVSEPHQEIAGAIEVPQI